MQLSRHERRLEGNRYVNVRPPRHSVWLQYRRNRWVRNAISEVELTIDSPPDGATNLLISLILARTRHFVQSKKVSFPWLCQMTACYNLKAGYLRQVQRSSHGE